jgi:hypothetical protein
LIPTSSRVLSSRCRSCRVDGQSGSGDFGIVADFVKHYLRATASGTIRGSDFDDPARFSPAGEADRDGHFVVKIL